MVLILLSWAISGCKVPAQEVSVSTHFSVVARLGEGGPRSLAGLDGGGIVVGTTRGIARYDGTDQRWFVPASAWVGSASAGGGRVAYGANDGAVGVLDGATGALIQTFSSATRVVVALSPDGARLALGAGRTVRIHDVASGALIREVDGFKLEITGLAWSPDGLSLAAADGRGTVMLLTGAQERALEGATDPTRGVAWSPDGRLVAAAGRPVHVWEAATGAEVQQILPGAGRAERLVFSPDGSMLAGSGEKGTVEIWAVADGTLRHKLNGVTRGAAELLWPEKHTLWMGGGAVSAVDPLDGVRKALLPLVSMPTSVHIRGTTLVWSSPDLSVLGDLVQMSPRAAWAAESGAHRVLRVQEDGRVWIADARGLRAVDARTGGGAAALEVPALGVASIRPDGGALAGATYGEDKAWDVVVWDLSNGAELWRVPGGRAQPTQLAWTADGSMVASHIGDVVQVYDGLSGAPRGRREGRMSNASGLAFSPTASLAASAGLDGHAELWDPQTGGVSHQLRRLDGSGWQLAWSPDGEALALAVKHKAGDRIHLANRAGDVSAALPGTTSGAVVRGLAWTPDHALLAATVGTGPNQGDVLVWSAAGTLLHTEAVTSGSPNALTWTEDGGRLFVVLGDGSALVLERQP